MKKQNDDQIGFTIVAGFLKGRRIVAPDLGVTRPPLTRLRKSIFDYLRPYLDEATYLDLFSGTGSYLFEAVSRGVTSATGVELESDLADSINRQAQKFKVGDRLNCLCADVFKQVPELSTDGRRFDIIMMAPPQYA
ncbi:MAG: RsmD family RNA methyltransferase, partial [candidate division Zixibacteria bacterium]|nr:RsmD family RNA methyltransferase [candidate division Zixibacteria bacterium]